MELNIMEWNIHQKGRQYSNGRSADNPIPDWIIDEVPNDMNIVVFTEFNSHARNISDIYSKLKAKGFSYYSTKFECPWSNDILIAIRGEQIEVKSTSAVDAISESRIRKVLMNEYPDSIKIIISSKLSSIKHADQILVLEDGKVTGIGSHHELYDNNELYRELCSIQGEQEVSY